MNFFYYLCIVIKLSSTMQWINEKEKLEELINQGIAYDEIGKMYNVSGAAIRKAAPKIGILLPRRRRINPKETFNKGKSSIKICKNCGKEFICVPSEKRKFCSLTCHNEYKSKKKYQDYLQNPDKYYGMSRISWVKKYILKEQEYKCAICGLSNSWNNKPLVLILDHIDGHANNNTRTNLRLICPNCDSQLDTYKSKNKNSDRVYYHLHHR